MALLALLFFPVLTALAEEATSAPQSESIAAPAPGDEGASQSPAPTEGGQSAPESAPAPGTETETGSGEGESAVPPPEAPNSDKPGDDKPETDEGDKETESDEPQEENEEDLDILPLAAPGEITIDGILYYCYANGEAGIRNASKATGDFTVPTRIKGLGGEDYLVTSIETYHTDRERGAFQGSEITSLNFEADSQLRTIAPYAFSAVYTLAGSSINLPASVTSVGISAFSLFENEGNYARLGHPHALAVNGSLPPLTPGVPLPLPGGATEGYEDAVDSTAGSTTMHKSARWTDEALTEAEIRIDYGRQPQQNAAIDFIFVLDYSSSMLNITSFTGSDGRGYTYPYSFISNDVVTGAAQIILDSAPAGYDNRVALTAFGGGSAPLWTSPFLSTAGEVRETLFNNPLSMNNGTNYNGGLQGALDLTAGLQGSGRTPVVIFLSDGAPDGGYNGAAQAMALRQMGVKVYPIATFTPVNSALRALSFDGATAYEAGDAAAFQSIIVEVMNDIIEDDAPPLAASVTDLLGPGFELAGGLSGITVSENGGTASLTETGGVLWDLTGAASGVVHSLSLRAKLAGDPLTTSGRLPTNDSLTDSDGLAAQSQPTLERYLVHHLFENADGEAPLPEEIEALLPKAKGGYRSGAPVAPDPPASDELVLQNGERWVFDGWQTDSATIEGGDVTFTGSWRRATVELDLEFLKVSSLHYKDGSAFQQPLAGAEFTLYRWAGEDTPAADELVTPAGIEAGRWQALGTATSGGDGRVTFPLTLAGDETLQLVEDTAPQNHQLPTGQWRLLPPAEEAGDWDITPVPGPDGAVPPTLEPLPEGDQAGRLALVNVPKYELPAMGGGGRWPFVIGGLALLAGAVALWAARRIRRRRRMERQVKAKLANPMPKAPQKTVYYKKR